eukprot:jgi/Botrbrau1/23315/Bobra.0102s0052.1
MGTHTFFQAGLLCVFLFSRTEQLFGSRTWPASPSCGWETTIENGAADQKRLGPEYRRLAFAQPHNLVSVDVGGGHRSSDLGKRGWGEHGAPPVCCSNSLCLVALPCESVHIGRRVRVFNAFSAHIQCIFRSFSMHSPIMGMKWCQDVVGFGRARALLNQEAFCNEGDTEVGPWR